MALRTCLLLHKHLASIEIHLLTIGHKNPLSIHRGVHCLHRFKTVIHIKVLQYCADQFIEPSFEDLVKTCHQKGVPNRRLR